MSDEPAYEDQPYRGTQILWGRVIVLLLALALSFWLGTTFGGDASAQGRLEDQRAEIAKLESEIASLEAEVAAVDAAGSGGEPEEPEDGGGGGDGGNEDDGGNGGGNNDGGDGGDGESEAAENEAGTTEYVVQSGDSLASIAQEVYGDPTLWQEIAQANDLSEPYALTVGDTLDIPEQP